MKPASRASKPAVPAPMSQLTTNLQAGDRLSIAGAFALHFMPRIREKLGGVPPRFTFLEGDASSPPPTTSTTTQEVPHVVRKTRTEP